MIDISLIIPVKDEEDNIAPLAEEIGHVMGTHEWSWECIWVDDGSTDRSLVEIMRVASDNPRHRYLAFKKNAGQSAALWAGFQESQGTYIGTLDGDRQNDPADILLLLNIITKSKQIDMVNGYRVRRRDNIIRKISSRIANGFRNMTTGKTVRDVGCSTRVFRRECVAHLPCFAGMHRFLPTLVAMQGFSLSEVRVNHRLRPAGRTKYNIRNRLWVGLVDIVGIMWLKRRFFHFEIVKRSEHPPIS